MQTTSNDSIIKLGRGVGMEILNAIKNSKSSVKIVSPYLSPDYIKELINLHNKGVEITLITCDNLETNQFSDFKPSDIIKKEKIQDKKLKSLKKHIYFYSFILFLVSIVSFAIISITIPLLLFIPITLSVIALILFVTAWIINDFNYGSNYHPIFRLKIFDSKSGINPQSTNLIHAKIFLIDNQILFLGSANFTYSAFKTHYETVIRVNDEKAIKDIDDEIENIYNSKELKEKGWERVV
ncbi:MAG: phospholipase D-like domain-containing protein [Nanoarchaeota archaeon]